MSNLYRLKPLEWVTYGDGQYALLTSIGRYIVGYDEDNDSFYVMDEDNDYETLYEFGDSATLRIAQKKVESHVLRKILEFLEVADAQG